MFLVVFAVNILFLRYKPALLAHEDHGNMGETLVYEFETFRLHIDNDRGYYSTVISTKTSADRWPLIFILEYLGIAEVGPGLTKYSLFVLMKELRVLSRNMARVRELFEENNLRHSESKLSQFTSLQFERFVEDSKKPPASR